MRDNALQKLSETIREGWPPHKHQLNDEVKAFWDFKDELSVYDDIVFRGERVVIPKSMQKFMIEKVHESHLGIVLCKRLARDVLFWPGMNNHIEEKVSKCGICQERRNKLPKETLIPSEIPSRPWSSVSSDLWEFAGIKHLITVDAYSGFFEVDVLNDESAFTTISCLKKLFATHGIPDEYKSDNGPQFDCREFTKFCQDCLF